MTQSGFVSRTSLMHADAPLSDFDRLTELEKMSGFRTGTRFGIEKKIVYEVSANLETGEFNVQDNGAEAVSLTHEVYKATSGLRYWVQA